MIVDDDEETIYCKKQQVMKVENKESHLIFTF